MNGKRIYDSYFDLYIPHYLLCYYTCIANTFNIIRHVIVRVCFLPLLPFYENCTLFAKIQADIAVVVKYARIYYADIRWNGFERVTADRIMCGWVKHGIIM